MRWKGAKSGNGTAARQWIYVLWNFPYVWVTKIGITGYPDMRLRDIDRTSPGWDFRLFHVRTFGAYQLEQFLHAIFYPFKVRFRGSGHTERFLSLVIPPALLIIIIWVTIERLVLLSPVIILAYFLMKLTL